MDQCTIEDNEKILQKKNRNYNNLFIFFSHFLRNLLGEKIYQQNPSMINLLIIDKLKKFQKRIKISINKKEYWNKYDKICYENMEGTIQEIYCHLFTMFHVTLKMYISEINFYLNV